MHNPDGKYPAGIRTQYFSVSSHNRTEWAIGAGQYIESIPGTGVMLR